MSSFLLSDYVGTESEELLIKLLFFIRRAHRNLFFLDSSRMCLVCENWKILKTAWLLVFCLKSSVLRYSWRIITISSHELKLIKHLRTLPLYIAYICPACYDRLSLCGITFRVIDTDQKYNSVNLTSALLLSCDPTAFLRNVKEAVRLQYT